MFSRYIDNFDFKSRFRILKGGKVSLVVSPLVLSSLAAFALIGCGGGSSSTTSNNNITPTTGVFIDDVVSGIKYVNGTASGFTNAKGEFSYTSGVIEFYLGDIKLGSVSSLPSDKIVYIQDTLGVARTNTTDAKVTRIASLLQSLDSNTSTDEIEIKEEDFNKFKNLNVTSIDESTDITTLLTNLNFTKVSDETVQRHLEDSLKYHNETIDTKAPTLLSSSITNGATNVSKDANIVLNFDEDMRKNTINSTNIVLTDSNSNVIECDLIHNLNVITINPKQDLSYATTYTLTIKKELEDYGKNQFGTTDTIITFTTQSEPDTTAPVIDSLSSYTVLENQTEAFTVTATDDSNTTITYSISGGADASLFSIDSTSGVVTFNNTVPDYESGKTSYSLTVKAIDVANNVSTKDVTVSITDVNENIITFNSLQYEIITSPITGKRWLDRNLGASQACTSSTDTLCYGDYYQWGRLADGHEKSNSTLSLTQASTITSVGNQFITGNYDWTTADSDGSLRIAQWSKTDGTGVCPVGFRVPTQAELTLETTGYTGSNNTTTGAVKVTNSATAFSNFLKFPVAGIRYYFDGSMRSQGSFGGVWTSSFNRSISVYMYFDSGFVDWYYGNQASGFSVRCREN